MYEEFFGLKRSPFELSPDPSFLYSSERTKDAVASMLHAICRRKGFVVMTGEVGTGKTLMLRCLFELLQQQQIPFAYVIGPRLSTTDFLSYVTGDLGIKVAEPTKGNLLLALYDFFLAQFDKGVTTVLVIDEAHQVSRSVLEEIRMLTNYETVQQKLVQVLLVGQPELNKTLDSAELRPLKQRIAVRCQMEPLNREEIVHYIKVRLKIAGAIAKAETMFPPEAIRAIYHYSMGIPRLVNVLCEQALIAAYARQLYVVSVQMIDEAASYFHLEATPDLEQTKTLPPVAPQTDQRLPVVSWHALPAVSEPVTRAFELNPWSTDVKATSLSPGRDALPSKPKTCHLVPISLLENTCPLESTLGITEVPIVDSLSAVSAISEKKHEDDVSIASPVASPFDSSISEPQVSTRSILGTNSKTTLTGLSTERNLSRDLNDAESRSRSDSRQSFGACLEYAESPWKGKLVAATVLVFVFVGCGIYWLQSRIVGNASAKNGAIASSLVTGAGDETLGTKSAQSTLEVNPASQSVSIAGGDPRVSELSEKKPDQPGETLKKESLPRVTPDSSETLNAQHVEAQKSHTALIPELQASPSNDDTIDTNGLGVPSSPDLAPHRPTDVLSESPVLPPAASNQVPAAATSKFQPAVLINRVDPTNAPISGTVQVKATIGIDGVPRQLASVGGEARLAQTAMDAIKRWRYQPALLDGRPIESQAVIEMKFVSALNR